MSPNSNIFGHVHELLFCSKADLLII